MSKLDEMNERNWSLSVKTVGGHDDFIVKVSPDDRVRALYDQIESATGLKACQQRLIYRGRLIEKGAATDEEEGETAEESKIKDIAGLDDGHTIHLVRKRETPEGEGDEPNNSTEGAEASSSSSGTNGSSSNSLLAALLGMGSEDGDSASAAANETSSRSSRAARLTNSRRTHYRLSSEDLQVPDPGSMEHVRQGLLTLHTILPTTEVHERPRQWYRGQWIDCRDTVNQWLEATIVDILRPEDILSSRSQSRQRLQAAPTTQPTTDPVVTASDVEGRRRLLLEPCEDDYDGDEDSQIPGFRERSNNDDVQLLLIHYNGWPHRWDEWIRSDSERIRPFRVRTRHPSASSTALPTPQSNYADAPPTFIRSEEQDRLALLPELSRVAQSVQAMLEESAALCEQQTEPRIVEEQLPWESMSQESEEEEPCKQCAAEDAVVEEEDEEEANEISNYAAKITGDEEAFESAEENFESVSEDHVLAKPEDPRVSDGTLRRQLETLAPLLDRLGRTLVDAAPHVAALAASLPAGEEHPESTPDEEEEEQVEATNTLGGLLSLLNRRRQDGDDATVEEENNSRITYPSNMAVNGSVQDHATTASEDAPQSPLLARRDAAIVEPDYADFAAGVVNTTRGVVRSGPRRRGAQSDDVAGLLGAYLAAASLASIAGDDDPDVETGLGRLLQRGAGGIDIHIHAVVTSPGQGGGGGGGTVGILAPVGAAPPVAPTTTNNTNNHSAFGSLFHGRDRRSSNHSASLPTLPREQEEEEMGIFAELYSETPDPVDLSAPPPGETTPETNSNHRGEETSRLTNRRSASFRNDTTPAGRNRRGNMLRRLFRRSHSTR